MQILCRCSRLISDVDMDECLFFLFLHAHLYIRRKIILKSEKVSVALFFLIEILQLPN